jgi:hypothetical protein
MLLAPTSFTNHACARIQFRGTAVPIFTSECIDAGIDNTEHSNTVGLATTLLDGAEISIFDADSGGAGPAT